MNIATIAEKLNIPARTLEKESIGSFLEKKLLETETELFSLANKYKIKSIKELDRLIKTGKIHETSESRDDFFRIDFLESQQILLRKFLKKLCTL